MKRKMSWTVSLVFAALLCLSLVSIRNVRAVSYDVMVIVDTHVWNLSSVRPLLIRYFEDIALDGFSCLNTTLSAGAMTAEALRSTLAWFFSVYSIKGVVLVGSFPTAKVAGEYGTDAADFFYMDLNGIWTDTNGDTYYDSLTGNIYPEIWIGRIQASVEGNEEGLYAGYFNKNHQYRTASSRFSIASPQGLAYIDNEPAIQIGNPSDPSPVRAFSDRTNDTVDSLEKVYANVTLAASPILNATDTNATDYMNTLQSNSYELVWTIGHGTVGFHSFDKYYWNPVYGFWYFPPNPASEGKVEYGYYLYDSPKAFFYIFGSCSAARFVMSNSIANSAIFGNGNGLASIGMTNDGGYYPSWFLSAFDLLRQHETIGEAFKEVYNSIINEMGNTWFKLVLLGDPTIRLNVPPYSPSRPSGPTSGYKLVQYTYYSSTTDKNEDNVRYLFDWGDGTNVTTAWLPSGANGSASHTWLYQGTYNVRVKAQDSYLTWSSWSANLTVVITQHQGGGGGGRPN